MTAKGGSLKFPSNPLASMRELADLDALDSQPDNHITDNITSNVTDQLIEQPTDRLTDNATDRQSNKPTGKPSGKTAGKPTDRLAGNASSQPTGFRAVAASIRKAVAEPAPKPLTKAVTLKMRPEIDAKIEEHCRASGRLKQDVIHDAVTLYFSVLEADENE